MKMNAKPKGWRIGSTDTRFADIAPSSYDAEARSVECVISMGSPVQRFYGTEQLRIAKNAVILDRMKTSGIPLLDSHQQDGIDKHLGRFARTWIASRDGQPALMGQIVFNDTERGRLAEGMVKRGEIAGISAGYTVREWEVSDKDGRIIDPETTRINFDDDLTFTATRWELHEGSLVSVPADAASMIRSLGSGKDRQHPAIDEFERRAVRITKRFGDSSITYEFPPTNKNNEDVRARMQARQAMYARMRT
jgi:phage head maturation protease